MLRSSSHVWLGGDPTVVPGVQRGVSLAWMHLRVTKMELRSLAGMEVWNMLLDGWMVYKWMDGLILLFVVVVAGGWLADGLQRERLVGARCRRSERTLPGELHAASGVRSLLGWRKPDRSRSLSHRVQAVTSQ